MQRGLVDWKGMDPMWVDAGEDAVVENTGEIFPGLVATGMSVTETFGLQEWAQRLVLCFYQGRKLQTS